ncbi:MFS-type transporter involved in bile tolerance, Atg22 family [Halogranum gelatinilyticum]|uniref:MFS-type transporter involved in bile tolerance, Atg22 family n=1 Tax=Halogranum gelatinilyticum TaxID=660521 RepID=A0A1G9TAH7_9EURY|nr:MFS transporter [Halogranum gelatinilyticum]SDM44713.1 MFS-type transporter involved in bile tolerance, Atg22 family [Halogranum gelatinilyticum]
MTLRDRLVVTVAAATRFGSGILMGTALGFYIGDGGGSDLAAALVYTAYFAGMMLFAPFWGAVADVTGRRRAVLVATGVGATLAVLPLVAVEATWAFVGLRGLYAAFAAAFPPVMLTVVSASGGDSGRGRAVGFFNSARAVGFTGGQLTAGALLGLFVPDSLFLVIAGVSLVSTIAVVFLTDNAPKPDADPTVAEVASEVRERLFPAVGDRAHLETNGLKWLYVALALRNMTVLGVMSLMPVYLPQSLGLSAFLMGVVLALNPGGQAVFMLLFGRVADVTGRKRLITLGMAGSALFALVAAAATLPASPTVRFAVAVVAFLLIAASFSAMTTGALAFIGDVAPADRESELMGLRTTAKGVGGVLGPVLVGGLALVVSKEVAFVVGAVPGLVATAIVAATLVESYGARAGVPFLGD